MPLICRPAHARRLAEHLRHWRQHRRLSQQGLALEAEISTRHLSYVETGRAQPSREMVLRLAERLSVPLRERNALLVAAGFALCTRPVPWTTPIWRPRARQWSWCSRATSPARPWPWIDTGNLVATNAVVPLLLDGVAPWLLEPPVEMCCA